MSLHAVSRSTSDYIGLISKEAFKSLAALEDPPRMPSRVSELYDPAAAAVTGTNKKSEMIPGLRYESRAHVMKAGRPSRDWYFLQRVGC